MIDRELADRLDGLGHRVRAAVDRFRRLDHNPDDPFRGLYLSDEQADDLLAPDYVSPSLRAGQEHRAELPIESSTLGQLSTRFGLTAIDVDLLVIAIAPDLDPRFERLYGYLHDDLSRRRASIGLGVELAGRSPVDPQARGRLTVGRPLLDGALLRIEERDRPFLTRSIRVADRVTAHLLGDDTVDGNLTDVVVEPSRPWGDYPDRIARVVGTRAGLYLHEPVEAGASGCAATGLRVAGAATVLTVDLSRAHPDDAMAHAVDAIREVRLTGGGLVAVGVEGLHPSVIRTLTSGLVPTVLVGREPWDPYWSDAPVHSIDFLQVPDTARSELWRAEFDERRVDERLTPPAFSLGPGRIRRALVTAQAVASERDEPIRGEHLALGARAQNSAGLARLARRIDPDAGWDDLVVAQPIRDQLEHLTARVAHRHLVLDQWGLRRGGGRGEGVIALFAGDSGTGKTLAAEIIAKELSLDLYVIDLSTVVDKYIGETEKNLDRIFQEAEGVNGILFFDEADALFGKRTEVSDARDRYANVEVAYLLQRLESFDGLGILATNLRANIDEAFARRLSVTIEFRDPDRPQRLALWRKLSARSPLGTTVDFDYLSEAFDLTGGNIRNVVVSAAYLAAGNGQVVEMHHLIKGTEIEYRKLGRLCTEAEFGLYYPLLETRQESA